MRMIWVIARQHFRLTLQNPQAWILLFVLPIVIVYLLGLTTREIARTGTFSINMDVLDLDQTSESSAFINNLEQANDYLVICPAFNDEHDRCALAGQELTAEKMLTRIKDEATSAYLVVPAGFGNSLTGAGDPIEIIFQPGSGLSNSWIVYSAVLDQVTRFGGPALAAKINMDFAKHVGQYTGKDDINLWLAEAQEQWSGNPPVIVETKYAHPQKGLTMGKALSQNGFLLSVPAISVMFVLISILGLTQTMAEEQSMGLLSRVGVNPITKFEYLTGKLLATIITGTIQFMTLLLFGRLLGVDYGNTPAAVLIIVLAYVLAASALAIVLATLTRSIEQAATLTTVTWIILIPLGGGWWPLIFVPTWLQQLGHISPVAWVMDALNTLIYYQGTIGDVILDGLVLLGFGAVFFVFGYFRFQFHQSGSPDSQFNPAPLLVDHIQE